MLSFFLALSCIFWRRPRGGASGHAAVQAPVASPGHTSTPLTARGAPDALSSPFVPSARTPKGGALRPKNSPMMDSRAEIARAWDLFHLGAFAEAEFLLLRHSRTILKPFAFAFGSRFAAATMRRSATWARGLRKMAMRNSRQSAARTKMLRSRRSTSPLKSWLSATSKWAQARSRYARALIAFIDERLSRTGQNFRRRCRRRPSSAFATQHFARGSTVYTTV